MRSVYFNPCYLKYHSERKQQNQPQQKSHLNTLWSQKLHQATYSYQFPHDIYTQSVYGKFSFYYLLFISKFIPYEIRQQSVTRKALSLFKVKVRAFIGMKMLFPICFSVLLFDVVTRNFLKFFCCPRGVWITMWLGCTDPLNCTKFSMCTEPLNCTKFSIGIIF